MTSGMLPKIFTESEMDEWVRTLKTLPKIHVRQNDCYGVSNDNPYKYWFQKNIFCHIQEIFGQDLCLQFGMLLNETRPWGIHTDGYHVAQFPDRQAAISFLVPYSVDGQKSLVTQSRTILFNEIGLSNDKVLDLPIKTDESNSAINIFQKHLSHNSPDMVSRMTVSQICDWDLGNLIYWSSNLYHDSDNFLANGYSSKQAIVVHTYFQK